MEWWRHRGLGFKLGLGITLTLLLILGGVLFGIARFAEAQLWQREVQTGERVNSMVAVLLEDAMMTGRKGHVQSAIEELGASLGGQIDSIAVYDDQAVLTSFASGFPGGRTIERQNLAKSLADPGCQTCHQLPSGERPEMTVVTVMGQKVMRNVVPLYNEPRCQTCHGTGKEVLGDSIVDLRLDRYEQASSALTLGLAGGAALATIFVALVLYLLLRRTVLLPLGELVRVTEAVTQGELEKHAVVRSGDEVGKLGGAFNAMTGQLRDLIGNLEQRVAERTRDLEQRSAYLEASSEVGQTASSILDKNLLVQQVVELIRGQFGLYYVGLFLVDERGRWAVLRAGTGKAGRNMLTRGHRLRVGEGMVGWSIANAQARIALDVGEDADRFDNPDLPDTRSEAALPLRSRGRVLGALTVQSTEAAAFDQDIIVVLQTMADQVAVALDNADLFTQSQEALHAERRAYGEISREAWRRMLGADSARGYHYEKGSLVGTPGEWDPGMIESGQSVETTDDGEHTLSIPIRVHDTVVGALAVGKQKGGTSWTEEEIAMVKSLTEQVNMALENARLYQESQRRAAREQLIGEATSRLRGSLDIDTVLQTAVRGIGDALGLAEVQVRLKGDREREGAHSRHGD
jgi:GAF domain-containing protein/HAMP domain-containing protein